MKFEREIISLLPACFFLAGMIFLVFSSLSVDKAINIQYDIVDIFMNELIKTNMSKAIATAFGYFWGNALFTIVIFLAIVTLGLVCYVYFYEKMEIKILIISQALFLVLSIILTNFSIAMFSISLSLLLGILWMHKTFEPRKNNFTTGYSVVSSRLSLLGILLSIGVFITIFINMRTYEDQMVQTNLKFLSAFIPNTTEIKRVQAEEIESLMGGFKSSLDTEYQGLSIDVKTQCKPMYDAMVVGIDSYKQQAIAHINEQEMPMVGVGDIIQQLPLFSLLVKITPLLIAISAYALLSIINPLFGIFGGIIYSIIKRVKSEIH